MKRRRNYKLQRSKRRPLHFSIALFWSCCLVLIPVLDVFGPGAIAAAEGCPQSETILPCRCSLRGKEIQIWCSHSNLPQIMDGIKAVERNIQTPIDELVLENNQLPALPGRFFGSLQIVRLMLRYNSIERVSNGWLNELENSLVEVYIVEPQLRSIPVESLNGMINMIAITIQSDELKHLPDFSGLLSLSYLSVQSSSLSEIQTHWFRHLPKLQNIHINGGPLLNRLESDLFDNLITLKNVDLSRNGINWIHIRALRRLPNLASLKLSYNQISDVGMIGRIVKDLENLKKLRLDHNIINTVEDGSFVDLPYLAELHLNDNRITEIQYGAFLRTPMLKTIYLHNNHIRRVHPESFLQASGSGVESIYMYNNEIDHIGELRSLLDALPALRFLDMSNNYLTDIPFGSLRGHGTLEQLHLNNNLLKVIERDALMAMPALRELRMRNNSLSSDLPMPFWNLPGLKGLDLSVNNFQAIDSFLLAGLPSLRRLDLSENGLTKLDPAAFLHNPMLETLNISSNELVILHPATFRNLDRLFEVDASYNQLMEIIPGLPKIVERISVRGNLITNLPISASKSLNLPNLRMLDLSYNRLEHLPKYAFKGVPQLRVLSLSNNRIRALDDTAFIGAQRLELLHLQDNELTQIDERAFLALPELRNLNLQGNKLEAITDNLFSNNSRLEQLDLSRNLIRTISPAAFESQRSLEYLDLSGNALTDMSISLAGLSNLRDIDLSYNQITRVHADVLSAWRNAVEVRLSNNLIVELKHGTFRNLPKLQYLDLSSNEISNVEPGALKNLPELQEFVLADNKLVDLKDHVFEELPNLLASHFQYNSLRYISAESFHNSPSMVFLNLSNNNFRTMENIGLRSMRNLEVLDLSTNGVRMVSTMPLKALSWLVELKMDNNQICKIQGAPFETMPRLRVLSMRNNRLRTIKERTFRNLRGNIAILDVDGNPIQCSCEMQWLSVWLQETNFPYPGPKCQDGRLLRASRMDRTLCSTAYTTDTIQRNGGGVGAADNDQPSSANHLPLLNEHGDVFQRELQDELSDECEFYEANPGERPLAGESEYFYDQYVDYTPGATSVNNASSSNSFSTDGGEEPVSHHLESNNGNLHSQSKKPTISSNIDLNNTVLNTNYFKRRPGSQASSSPFTFFGYPIPSLSLGRFFGAAQRGRKDRGEPTQNGDVNERSTTSSSMGTVDIPATHRMQANGHSINEYSSTRSPGHRGKVRMYQPNSAEFEKYLQQGNKGTRGESELEQDQSSSIISSTSESAQYHDVNSRNRFMDAESDETASSDMPQISGGFRTSFREPTSIERGGFRPILPDHISIGGFMPVHDPARRNKLQTTTQATTTTVTATTSQTIADNMPHKRANAMGDQRNYVPLKAVTSKSHKIQVPESTAPPALSSTSTSVEAQTYYVTETPLERVTSAMPVATTTTRKAASSSTATQMVQTLAPQTTEAAVASDVPAQYDDDLEAQSIGVLRPPPLLQTTTAETILLIPPPEEHEAQIKRHSWVTPPSSNQGHNLSNHNENIDDEAAASGSDSSTWTSTLPRGSGHTGSGRSTITKVHTPQTLNHYLPKAEEYFHRTTPSNAGPHQRRINGHEANDGNNNNNELVGMASGEDRLFANAEEHKVQDESVGLQQQLVNDAQRDPSEIDRVDRKDGMDWYYDSFKKRHQFVGGAAGKADENTIRSGMVGSIGRYNTSAVARIHAKNCPAEKLLPSLGLVVIVNAYYKLFCGRM